MTQPLGSGAPDLLAGSILFDSPLEFPETPTPLIAEPTLAGENPDVVGDYAYFNNLVLKNPSIIQGGGVNTSLIPVPPSTLDLGSATNHWRTLYADSIIPAPTGALNLLVNGGFEIWQRGVGPLGGYGYLADRWLMNGQTGSSVARDSANADVGSVYCMAIATTSASTPGSPTQVFQYPEFGQFKGKVITFSVRVRVGVANAARLTINDGTTSVYSAYHTGDNTYRTLTVTTTLSTTATQCALGINIETALNGYIDNAMLVIGNNPIDYYPLTPADDLARCLRYFEIINLGTSNGAIGVGSGWSTTQVNCQPFVFKVRKAIIPTTITATLIASPNSGNNLTGTANFTNVTVDFAPMYITFGGSIVAGTAYTILTTAVNQAFTFEANP